MAAGEHGARGYYASVAIAAVIIFFSIYLPLICGAFPLLDDFTQIEGQARRWPLGKIFGESAGFYRPLFLLFLKGEYLLFGWEDLWGYAAASFLLHLANSGLMGVLAGRLFRSGKTASLVGFFWFLNPSCIETVFWTAAQNEALGAFFALVALNVWLGAVDAALRREVPRAQGLAAGAAISQFLSLLCKESALGLPVLMAAVALTRLNSAGTGVWGSCRRLLPPLVLASLGSAVFVALRFSIAGTNSQYGGFHDLFANAHVVTNIARHFFYLVSFKYDGGQPMAVCFVASGGILFGVAVLLGLLRMPSLQASLLLLSAIAIFAPAIWIPQGPYWFIGGRLGYLAQVPLFLGLAEFVRNRLLEEAGSPVRFRRRRLAIALSVFVCASASFSLHASARRYRVAHSVARRHADYIAENLTARPTIIRGVPNWMVQGPPLLDCWAVRQYLVAMNKPLPPLACDLVDLKAQGEAVRRLAGARRDASSSDLSAESGAVLLDLPADMVEKSGVL